MALVVGYQTACVVLYSFYTNMGKEMQMYWMSALF